MEKMIFIDKPFVSDFLRNTIKENGFTVVKTKIAEKLGFNKGVNILDEENAIQQAKSSEDILIYTISENSIGWIAKHLSSTKLPQKIELFKDKVKFRTLIKSMYPDFYFREIQLYELDDLSLENIPMPFIIKPAVGFFSMGVYKVTGPGKWEQVKKAIREEILRSKDFYPTEVLNTRSFIIEQCIEGEEFAVDAYFDGTGDPVILNIHKHIFSSNEDVSDRIYISSKEIIESNIDQFSVFLKKIGKLSGVKNFPVHAEIRRERTGSVLPIEINPMRFGGWCTTADAAHLAYGFNPYVLYFSQKRPEWKEILKNKEGKLYSIIVLDNSTGTEGTQIASFDYDLLLSNFEKPLELRKIDYEEYPVFGFLFTETKEENILELERILKSDLKEFITVNE
ncbi:MAG TPA: ATP-grasp domain-containing protein [Desulfobacteraceae bacterium]|nr:ATP-grasp domain-containing protein [Desulfobacteraceae bacterium]HPJ67293.1 ATP-grasp domain-containing protein [Desulfobacteraceae bacterium]HPQ29270.1 ATP-grasp domain-containing protein [Desulfobacteraceae bacterium]